MSDYYFSANIDNDRALFISPLTDYDLEQSGESVEDASGYFLYQRSYAPDDGSITLLARLVSKDAAVEMSRLLKLE